MSSYKDVIEWLFNLRRFGSKPGLERISYLLKALGDPHERFRAIHITGTNGKGSTTAMAASILRAAGFKVGMYTSPHLSSFTERIIVDDDRIPVKEVVRLVEEIRPIAEEMEGKPELGHPTFFEVTTAIGFEYFAEQGVDLAVVEVGMGGKLDATNVVHSLVSVITNVSLEHTEVLGKTVLEIAEKKAGIIKEGAPLITAAEQPEVLKLFEKICRERGSEMFIVGRDIRYRRLRHSLEGQWFNLEGLRGVYENLHIRLLGRHQLRNASCAVGAVEALSLHDIEIPEKAIREGLSKARWPGRLEVVQRRPLVVLDCAKDPKAAENLSKVIQEEFDYNRLIIVVSISSDKDIPSMIDSLSRVGDYFIVTRHGVMGRAADPAVIAGELKRNSKPYEIVEGVGEAVERALEMAGERDMILITGSVFTVGEARERWFKPPNEI